MIKNLMRVMPICFALLMSCEGAEPAGPAEGVPRSIVPGDYLMIATGGSVSNAWENYGIRLEGILTLRQDPEFPAALSGTFTELRSPETDLMPNALAFDGKISGSINARGSVILELRTPSGQFAWTGRGIVSGSQIAGHWTSSHPGAGGFTAGLMD